MRSDEITLDEIEYALTRLYHVSPWEQENVMNYGYVIVSKDSMAYERDLIGLRDAGANYLLLEEKVGPAGERPTLTKLLNNITSADTLIVNRLDSLAPRGPQRDEILRQVGRTGAQFRFLADDGLS